MCIACLALRLAVTVLGAAVMLVYISQPPPVAEAFISRNPKILHDCCFLLIPKPGQKAPILSQCPFFFWDPEVLSLPFTQQLSPVFFIDTVKNQHLPCKCACLLAFFFFHCCYGLFLYFLVSQLRSKQKFLILSFNFRTLFHTEDFARLLWRYLYHLCSDFFAIIKIAHL